MRKAHIVCAAAGALFLASCGGDDQPDAPDGAPPTEDFLVRVWAQDHADLPKDQLVRGCQLWAPVGVSCVLASDEIGGTVRVHADASPCSKGSDGRVILAWAEPGGKITVRVKCLSRDLFGNLDHFQLRWVMGHEAGHEFGIWEHVPDSCDGQPPIHPDGREICGDALMNATFDRSISAISEPDRMAFDVRRKDVSVLIKKDGGQQPLVSAGGPVICILKVPLPLP